ncbi:nuclease-related domain-containing protein [Mesorhizobium sp. VK9D]|uniref:nuclease-related domain-containing protein n=1 Tax=Mesorhizobium australafricanum TaxID=3072311 RepID=UPI002A244C97|nr:nuclease-related domain-containing protein [Mesorhizobium sp. VK9D]MDX8455194.1 nuclease-related domain-containing protein [Mesorhizobium sp. VK9D]
MTSLEIFIGTPIEHPSERATLERAVATLSAYGIPAVVLANVNFGGRQIDLVIGLDRRALVIESKGFSSAVRGGENGTWHVQLASGQWKEIPNLYAQTLGEKNALRDAMAAFAGASVPYPDAALVFVPAIPPGSAIPSGDFKVSVGGLGMLPALIASAATRGWSLDQWRAFAAHHRLIAVPSLDAALSSEVLHAERLLLAYGDAFTRTYGPTASEMVPMRCIRDGETLSSEAVVERVVMDGNVLLAGDSGCGKSLLSYKAALFALGQGCVPIVIPAKDFEGSLRDVANREATLLDAQSAAALISAARVWDRPLVLVVDGYNECAPSERQRLTRSVAAAVRRFDAIAVVSSRIALERGDLLAAVSYTVQAPDVETKQAIARNAAGGARLEAFSELFEMVGSGLEARMVGQLGQSLPAGTTRYGLFDAYVRKRLGPAASDGIRALSRIAGAMTDRVSFSLSVRELDRLSDREGVAGSLLQTLQAANLLERRGDRVSFSHEMFMNVFAAEAILRRAGDNPDAVALALRHPRYLEMKPFVLGAIDDDRFRRRVLSDVSDAWVVSACLAGQFGRDAERWANTRCDEVLARIGQEIETVRFDVSKEFAWSVQARPETLQEWTAQDRAVLTAIAHELVTGRRLDQVLDLIAKMDARLAEEHGRLLDEARKHKLSLRSGLYAMSYTGFAGREIGLAYICGPVHSGHLYHGPKVAAEANLFERLRSEKLSPGQVGLLIELDKYSERDAPSVGILLPAILNRLWAKAAGHLRMALMHAAGMSAHALTDDERQALIDVIHDLLPTNNGFDSTGMIDALKFLGALDNDEEEYVTSAKREIEAVLANRDDPLMAGAAASLWSAQFDHPYDGAYWEAWGALPSEDRNALLLLAAQDVDRNSMFSAPLLAAVASCGDPAAGPAIAPWTALPPKKEVMMQDAVRTFEMAHAALARLHYPLPDRSAEAASPADQAFLACGAIIYWLNRDDLSKAERMLNCAAPLAALSRHEHGVAAAAIGEFSSAGQMFEESRRLPGSEPVVTSFAADFPNEIAAIYRAALEQPARQAGYFEFFRTDDVMQKALAILGEFGDASDVPLLRAWSIHPSYGHVAVRAIKRIEESPH